MMRDDSRKMAEGSFPYLQDNSPSAHYKIDS